VIVKQLVRRLIVKQSLVKILVVVAIIQRGCLKAEVDKDSM
jgi:hypothetical protein